MAVVRSGGKARPWRVGAALAPADRTENAVAGRQQRPRTTGLGAATWVNGACAATRGAAGRRPAEHGWCEVEERGAGGRFPAP